MVFINNIESNADTFFTSRMHNNGNKAESFLSKRIQ